MSLMQNLMAACKVVRYVTNAEIKLLAACKVVIYVTNADINGSM